MRHRGVALRYSSADLTSDDEDPELEEEDEDDEDEDEPISSNARSRRGGGRRRNRSGRGSKSSWLPHEDELLVKYEGVIDKRDALGAAVARITIAAACGWSTSQPTPTIRRQPAATLWNSPPLSDLTSPSLTLHPPPLTTPQQSKFSAGWWPSMGRATGA